MCLKGLSGHYVYVVVSQWMPILIIIPFIHYVYKVQFLFDAKLRWSWRMDE